MLSYNEHCYCAFLYNVFFQDVTRDTELQGWAYDLAHECLGWQDGNTRGMPDKISSISKLVRGNSLNEFLENRNNLLFRNKDLDHRQAKSNNYEPKA